MQTVENSSDVDHSCQSN